MKQNDILASCGNEYADHNFMLMLSLITALMVNCEHGKENKDEYETDSSEDSDTMSKQFTCKEDIIDNCITGIPEYAGFDVNTWGPSLVIGSDGYGVVGYSDWDLLKVLHCKNITCSKYEINVVDKGDTDWDCDRGYKYMTQCEFAEPITPPQIQIGVGNMPILAYRYYLSETTFITYCKDIVCSDVEIKDMGIYASTRTQTLENGTNDLLYYAETGFYLSDYTGNSLGISHCDSKLCNTLAPAKEIDTDVRYSSMKTGSDGYLLITYIACMENKCILNTAHCSDNDCNNNTINTQDTGKFIEGNSIAIGSDGLGVISYNKDGKLAVAHCADIECSSADINIVDDMNGLSSITVGTDGLPLIAYRGRTNIDLKVAHCEDMGCKEKKISTLDADNFNTDQYGRDEGKPGVAIGSDGLPLIAYTAQGWLRILHCANANCAP